MNLEILSFADLCALKTLLLERDADFSASAKGCYGEPPAEFISSRENNGKLLKAVRKEIQRRLEPNFEQA